MNIKMMDVAKLVPYKNNPRVNHEAVEYVANSIKEFGFKVPIVVDGDNVVVTGHTRLLAVKKLGITQVPIVVADDLTGEQVKAFRLADNKVGEIAEWDNDLLLAELEELNEIDMTLFSFEEENHIVDIDDIFFNDEEQHQKDTLDFLKWGKQKTFITQQSMESLDKKLNQYNNTAETNEEDFVQWLLTEGNANSEVDVS